MKIFKKIYFVVLLSGLAVLGNHADATNMEGNNNIPIIAAVQPVFVPMPLPVPVPAANNRVETSEMGTEVGGELKDPISLIYKRMNQVSGILREVNSCIGQLEENCIVANNKGLGDFVNCVNENSDEVKKDRNKWLRRKNEYLNRLEQENNTLMCSIKNFLVDVKSFATTCGENEEQILDQINFFSRSLGGKKLKQPSDTVNNNSAVANNNQ